MNSKKTAQQILQFIGGEQNINNLFHCMTRLRFNLKDIKNVDVASLKEVEGVLGIQEANQEFQVIIGPAVQSVYKELIGLTTIQENEIINEDFDTKKLTSEKKHLSIKKIFNEMLNVMSASLAPLVPLFVVVGLFNTVAVLIGPQFLKLVSEDSDIYRNFYFVGQSILYFLPILVGYAASRRLGSNTLITMALASFMLYPDFVAIATNGATFSYLGISIPIIDYSTSVIPIILIAWGQSKIETFLNKTVPDVIKVIVIPCLTVLIMLPIGLAILGPLGNYIGVGLGTLIVSLYDIAGPLATTLAGATAVISGAFGITRPIFFITLSTMLTNGVEYAYMPIAMAVSNWVMLGALVGFVIRAKNPKQKQLGISCTIALFFGGVSEPALYGIFLQRKKILISTAIAGGIAGLYLGLMSVGYYVFGPSNFLNVLGFVGGPTSNLVNGIIACAIGFISSGILTFVMDREHSELSNNDNVNVLSEMRK